MKEAIANIIINSNAFIISIRNKNSLGIIKIAVTFAPEIKICLFLMRCEI